MKDKIKLIGRIGILVLGVVALIQAIIMNIIGYLISMSGIVFLTIIIMCVLDGLDEYIEREERIRIICDI